MQDTKPAGNVRNPEKTAAADAARRLEQLEKANAELRAMLEKANSTIASGKEQIKKLKREAARAGILESQLGSVCLFLAGISIAASEQLRQYLSESREEIPDVLLDEMRELLKDVAARVDHAGGITGLAAWYLNRFSEKSSRRIAKVVDPKGPLQEMVGEAARTVAAIDEAEKKFNNVIDLAGECARKAAEDDPGNPKLEAFNNISRAAENVKPENAREALEEGVKALKTAGRKRLAAKDGELPVYRPLKPFPGVMVCPRCGGETRWTRWDTFEKAIRTIKFAMENCIETGLANYEVWDCTKCGFRHLHMDSRLPLPVTVGGTVSQDMAIDAAMLVTAGVPLNRFEKITGSSRAQMGSSTLGRNIHMFATAAAGNSLFNGILASVKQRSCLVVDETPFNVNQKNGRSVRKLENTAKQAYVLAVTNVDGDDRPFRIYFGLESRSAASIKKVVGDWKFEKAVTDAYAAYPVVFGAREGGGVIHQSCLVHFRRRVIVSLGGSGDMEATEENIRILTEKVKDPDETTTTMLAVANGLAAIYRAEEETRRRPGESREDHIERVRLSRQQVAAPVMDSIDTLMGLLKEGQTEAKGSRYSRKGSDPAADAVVYYFNNREELRTFLAQTPG